MKSLTLLLFILLNYLSLNGQDISTFKTNDSLSKDADAIVRYSTQSIQQYDINKATYRVKTVTTVLNKKGNKHAEVVINLDQFRKLKSFSGKVSNPLGQTIKKIKKGDLKKNSYSIQYVSDNSYEYFKYTPSSYPFTIEFEYEVSIEKGLPFYPRFYPVNSYSTSIEKATYEIETPKNIKIRHKSSDTPYLISTVQEGEGTTIYKWEVQNFPAIKRESYAPPLSELTPFVHIAPSNFCMDGYCGNMSEWDSLGKWLGELMPNPDVISENLKQELISLTENTSTTKEKVKKVYEYLQTHTRYVSIQYGIGGFQPIRASEVEKSAYGDCKALSNFMKVMLKAIGIESNYVVINTINSELYDDFSSIGQMNHAILAVPLPSDTLWIECTSQILPFNYIHSNITGHQCLLLTDKGGELVRVKKTNDVYNSRTQHISAKVDVNGDAKAKINATYHLHAYEDMQSFIHTKSNEEQIKSLNRLLKINNTSLSNLQITNNNTETPSIELRYDADMKKLLHKSGSRFFLNLSLLKHPIPSINTSNRQQDIVFKNEFLRKDTLTITYPQEFTPESIPKSSTISSEFGEYSFDIIIENNTLQITQQIFVKNGVYPANKIDDLKEFVRSIENIWRGKGVFNSK